MKIKQILRRISYKFKRAGISNYHKEAEDLLVFLLHRPAEWLIAHNDFELPAVTVSVLRDYIHRRLKGEPLAYITGNYQFYGREFSINKNVLIPRMETELLMQEIVNKITRPVATCHSDCSDSVTEESLSCHAEFISASHETLNQVQDDTIDIDSRLRGNDISKGSFCETNQKLNILEVGTGSGVIAITLALELEQLRFTRHLRGGGTASSEVKEVSVNRDYSITATDISRKALKVARDNARRFSIEKRIKFIKSDLTDRVNGEFDIIIANLPYVPTRDTKDLHDPKIALDGGADGMKSIKKLLRQIEDRQLLSRGGSIFLEIGYNQAKPLSQYIQSIWPKAKIKIFKDLAGYDRILRIMTSENHR